MRLRSLTLAARALNLPRYSTRILINQIAPHQKPYRVSPVLTRESHSGTSSSFLAFASMASETESPAAMAPGAPAKRSRPYHQKSQLGKRRQEKKLRKRERDMQNGSAEQVLAVDIADLRASLEADGDKEEDTTSTEEALPEPGTEIIVKVLELSSTGDGLAIQDESTSKHIYVVPFSVPGDKVKVKVYRHLPEEQHTVADFVSVVEPSPRRDDSRIACRYFAQCSGCQFQMLDYAEQLRLKQRIVEKAFRNFSELPPELIPAIQDTIGSPLQYGYRTKLTPHFDGPPGNRRHNTACFTERPPIGFMPKGKRTTIDIEDCPIGTEAVLIGMKSERERMAVEFGKYKRGATILLRESTQRLPKDRTTTGQEIATPPNAVKVETDTHIDLKTCVTDNNGTSTEYIENYVFHNPAGSFFQNNNSILPTFTSYIRQHILPTSPSTPIKYLIDAYSGSGLFTITLSSLFQGSTGIDIADKSIDFAVKNASANNLPLSQANFIAADAGELFMSVTYPPDETVVVLDPPRKGCDADFLSQLLRFGPKRVVYVSCNVHTQARDVGMLVRGETGSADSSKANEKGTRYTIESLRGFDFFPQTGHVEGVAVLNRVDATA